MPLGRISRAIQHDTLSLIGDSTLRVFTSIKILKASYNFNSKIKGLFILDSGTKIKYTLLSSSIFNL